MNWKRTKTIMKKDLKAIMGNKRVFLPMFVTPLLLLLLTPLIIILSLTTGKIKNLPIPEDFFNNLPDNIKNILVDFTQTEQIIYLFSNYIMATTFIMIPLLICSWTAATSIVHEKENKTMGTLLYAPISKMDLFVGKILGAYIPSLVISYTGLIIYLIMIYLLTYDYFGFYILETYWLYLSLLLLPVSLLFGITANILMSIKAKNVQEAQQFSIIITFPFMLIMVSQVMGSLYLDATIIIWLSLAFLILNGLTVYLISKKYTNEKILKI